MCVVFTNCGFMALPLLDALYGSHGLFLGSAFIAVNNILLWSYGITQLSHETSRSQKIRNALINPGTISVVIGLIFFLTPLDLPAIPATCVSYLASLNTPGRHDHPRAPSSPSAICAPAFAAGRSIMSLRCA